MTSQKCIFNGLSEDRGQRHLLGHGVRPTYFQREIFLLDITTGEIEIGLYQTGFSDQKLNFGKPEPSSSADDKAACCVRETLVVVDSFISWIFNFLFIS